MGNVARYSNVSGVPTALGVFLASDEYDYDNTPKTISATTLMKPLRQIILPSRLPADVGLVDLGSMLRVRIGAAVHEKIERAWMDGRHINAMKAMGIPDRAIALVKVNPQPDELTEDTIPVYIEQRTSTVVNGWNVTGKYDIVFNGRVEDFKTASVLSYMKQQNAAKQGWQGSLYRWLNPKIVTDAHMRIHHIFLDWKPGMRGSSPDYPPEGYVSQTIELHSLEKTQQFVESKINLIEKYWDAHESVIPECDDEELWRSEPVFKYYKNPLKTQRSTKNFETMHEAQLRRIEDGSVGIVREIPGQVTACKYCPAFDACTQKDRLIQAGDLIL